MAVHDHTVLRVDLQPCGMAHHVCRKFGGVLAAVRETPEKLRGFAAVRQAHKAEIDLRRVLHVLEVLARTGDEEVLSVQFRAREARRDIAQNSAVRIFLNVGFVQQQTDVAAVALVPAVVIHIGGSADHLHHPRSCQNIFHALASKTFFS